MIADWSVPFFLTSQVYSSSDLAINQLLAGGGYYFLRSEGCDLRNTVRAQKNDIPQADGAILHRRFTSGMEMDLAIQFWETPDQIACDTLQKTMLDDLMGYLYGLLNAGDNEGRIYWQPAGNSSTVSIYRMLDDIRLLTYPKVTQLPNALGIELTFTVDCALPYAEDLTPQTTPTTNLAVGNTTITNYGNRPLYPVFRIYSGNFTLSNTTTNFQFVFDDSLPGVLNPLGSGDFVEINTLNNTAYLNGDEDNLKPAIQVAYSDFFMLVPGDNVINLTQSSLGTSYVEHNNAWA